MCDVTTIIFLNQNSRDMGKKDKEFLSFISKKKDRVATYYFCN